MIIGITSGTINAYTLANLVREASVKPVSPAEKSPKDYERIPLLNYGQLRELMEIYGSVPRSPLPEATRELLKMGYLDVWV